MASKIKHFLMKLITPSEIKFRELSEGHIDALIGNPPKSNGFWYTEGYWQAVHSEGDL
jgi:hypothetical protein